MPADAVFGNMIATLEVRSVDPAVVLIEAPKATRGAACPRQCHPLEFTGSQDDSALRSREALDIGLLLRRVTT